MPTNDQIAQHPLVKTVAEALRGPCDVPEGAVILVAVSGGADSVALLRALAALAPRRNWKYELTIGHVQHHLRDSGNNGHKRHHGDAEDDAQFVQALAATLALPFLRRDLDAGGLRIGNIEHNARRARYDALASMADECEAGFVATGHHGDDQLETVLMRILRGASFQGMSGIAWERRLTPDCDARLIRPMLELESAAVRAFLTKIGQTWREDHTNADVSRLRARLRQDITPLLRELQPTIVRRINMFALQMGWGGQLLKNTVDEVMDLLTFEDIDGNLCLDRVEARNLLPLVLTEIVRDLLLASGVPADALTNRTVSPLMLAIIDAKGGRRKFPFAGGVTAVVRAESVVFEKEA